MRKFPWPSWYIPPAPQSAKSKAKRAPAPKIVREACELRGISYSEFMSPCKAAGNTEIRQALVFALHRRRTDLSWPQIARLVGRKDHSTVIHAYRQAEVKIARSPEFAELVMRLEAVG